MDPNTSKPIGLIAGAGDIPVYFAHKARERGKTVVSVSFTDEIGQALAPYVHKNFSISPVKAGKILKQFEQEHIRDILILGKVEKKMIFQPQMFDLGTIHRRRCLAKNLRGARARQGICTGFVTERRRRRQGTQYQDEGVLEWRIACVDGRRRIAATLEWS